MLTLSCVPCVCNDICATEQAEHNNSSNENHEEEDCTPFCNCSCCNYVLENVSVVSSSQFKINFVSKLAFPLIVQNFSSFNSHNIWQPPKLS
jgi:hypothetical protein